MKTLCTLTFAVATACFLPVWASEPAAAQRVEITSPRAVVTAAQVVLGTVDEDQLFELSNGRLLRITSFGDHLQMRYGSRLSSVLRHDGEGNFVSRDRRVTLQFDAGAQGEARLVRLTAPHTWF